jgi:hypothetical protein
MEKGRLRKGEFYTSVAKAPVGAITLKQVGALRPNRAIFSNTI